MERLSGRIVLILTVLLMSGFVGAGLVASQDGTDPPASECTPTSVTDHAIYAHPLVKERWDRASSIAPNTCLMPTDGPIWECYYAEALPGGTQRICWKPLPDDFGAGAPGHFDVIIDLGTLSALAEEALGLQELRTLVGSGRVIIDIVVGAEAARLVIDNYRIIDASYTALPPLCTPFDVSEYLGTLPASQSAEWNANSANSLGVCATIAPPDPDECEAIDHAPGTHSFLCWWGTPSDEGADYRLDVAPDALRSILNADDAGPVAKAALSKNYIVVWASDPWRRAALGAALQLLLDSVPELLPPADDVGQTITLFGRPFTIQYFPREGVLTPCARDDQGTWYWLNELGVPNGFVGPSTIQAMKKFIEEHGTTPTEAELLDDLYLNYDPDTDYIYVPGSPFSLLPVAQKADGSYVRLRGDGSEGEAVPADQADAIAKKVAAAQEIAKHVDFNQQPGTLSQDLAFLSYAVTHNPAAPQIAAILQGLADGNNPDADAVTGLFPPESPRIELGAQYPHPDMGTAVASGDAYALGMAAHHLLWFDLLRYGAIQPDAEEASE